MLVDGPLVFNLGKASRGEKPFDFHRGAPLRFGVMPRRGGAGDVVWIDAECCFAYHGAMGCAVCMRVLLPSSRLTRHLLPHRSRQLLG